MKIIKWQPVKTASLSIIKRVDDFMEQPVYVFRHLFRKFRAETDIERKSHYTSTPESRDVRRPLLILVATVKLSIDEPPKYLAWVATPVFLWFFKPENRGKLLHTSSTSLVCV